MQLFFLSTFRHQVKNSSMIKYHHLWPQDDWKKAFYQAKAVKPALLYLTLSLWLHSRFSVGLWFSVGFPDSSVGRESTCNTRDPGSIPGLGRSPGEGTSYPFQYYTVHGVPKCQTWLSNFHFHFDFLQLEYDMPVLFCFEFTLVFSQLFGSVVCCL